MFFSKSKGSQASTATSGGQRQGEVEQAGCKDGGGVVGERDLGELGYSGRFVRSFVRFLSSDLTYGSCQRPVGFLLA